MKTIRIFQIISLSILFSLANTSLADTSNKPDPVRSLHKAKIKRNQIQNLKQPPAIQSFSTIQKNNQQEDLWRTSPKDWKTKRVNQRPFLQEKENKPTNKSIPQTDKFKWNQLNQLKSHLDNKEPIKPPAADNSKHQEPIDWIDILNSQNENQAEKIKAINQLSQYNLADVEAAEAIVATMYNEKEDVDIRLAAVQAIRTMADNTVNNNRNNASSLVTPTGNTPKEHTKPKNWNGPTKSTWESLPRKYPGS